VSDTGTGPSPFASPPPDGPPADPPLPADGAPAEPTPTDPPPPPFLQAYYPPQYFVPEAYPVSTYATPDPHDWAGYKPFTPKPYFTYRRQRDGVTVPSPWPGAPIQAIDAGLKGDSLRIPSWGIPDSIVSQIAAIVVTLGFISLYYALTPDTAAFNITAIFASLFVQWAVMAGWPIFVSYWRGNGIRLDFGFSFSRHDIGPGLLGAVTCLFGVAVAAAITQALFGQFGSNAGQVADDLSSHHVAQLAFMFLGVFGAPVVEELGFRGLLWGALAKRGINPWWCTVITAVAFAGVHMELVRFGVLLVAGMVLGVLRQTTGRLGPSMLAHMGLNAIAFFGTGFMLFS
jgi:membrane protease YdiL (CAAX protease family)